MDKDNMRKICFDLEDRPPLSYWEERQLSDGTLQSSLIHSNKHSAAGNRQQLRMKPEAKKYTINNVAESDND
uniref:Ovule protein n=1 Tax=Syphacia muris TaxID=451379 RepID=A0A0N5AH15_9BILA